jgi:rhomboid family GlyGly-CTERM serine protease
VFFLALCALAVLAAAAGPRAFAALAFDRAAILRGQVWRLLTTHLVHAGALHLLWNVAAAAVVWLAVGRALRGLAWLAAALVVALAASAAVLLLQPDVRMMAGLSGLLHGLLAAGAVADVRRGERLGWAFLALLALKVGWEQLAGAPPLAAGALGGPIATGAHAFAAVSGLAAGLLLPVSRPQRAALAMTSRNPRP